MPRHLPITVVLLAAGLVLWGGTPAGVIFPATLADETIADQRQHERQPTQEEIAALVEQLSDDDYRVREPASTKLVQIGIAARPLLVEALENPDVEIRHRATRILTLIVEKDFQQRISAFAADIDGKNKTSLPGWERFGERLGQDKYARALFVEMHRSESELLSAYRRGTNDMREVSQAFNKRCREINEMLQTYPARWQSEISMGTIATLLLIGSEPGVATSDKVSVLVSNLLSRDAFDNGMRAKPTQPLLRKLLGDWIAKSTITNIASVSVKNLRLAMLYNLEEGLEPAIQMVNQTAVRPDLRTYAALAIGKLGSMKNLPDLEPLLKDTTLCRRRSVIINNKRKFLDVQFRDVVLAVMLHLSGQQLSDYGYRMAQTNNDHLFEPSSLVFFDGKDRRAALAKWKQWSSRQQRGGADASARNESQKAKEL